MLQFYDNYVVEINFSLIVSLSMVHEGVFVTSKISCFVNTLISHNSLLRARREFLGSFFDFSFHLFGTEITFFNNFFIKTFLNFHPGETYVTVIKFSCFAPRNWAVIIQIMNLKCPLLFI